MLSIGSLTKRSGVKAPTIRYYEKIGLLDDVARTPGGQRRYAEEDVQRLRLIRQARALGLEVGEIKRLLDLDEGKLAPARAREEAAVFARAVDVRIRLLRALGEELARARQAPPVPGALRRVLVGARLSAEGGED